MIFGRCVHFFIKSSKTLWNYNSLCHWGLIAWFAWSLFPGGNPSHPVSSSYYDTRRHGNIYGTTSLILKNRAVGACTNILVVCTLMRTRTQFVLCHFIRVVIRPRLSLGIIPWTARSSITRQFRHRTL